jgi:prevent-host-death family protein
MSHSPSHQELGAYEVKTHFAQILDRVAHGETITVTRHGKPVARIVPEPRETAPSFKQWLTEGPDLDGLDITRDSSPMRETGL